jgi:hypothetical protein
MSAAQAEFKMILAAAEYLGFPWTEKNINFLLYSFFYKGLVFLV